MTKGDNSPPEHIRALDGLRGVAVLMVLVCHFYYKPFFVGLPILANILSRVGETGRYGVELFFVLSGFLITGILVDNKDKPGSLRKFYMRRVLRIFPLYYIVLVAVFLVLPSFVRFDTGAKALASHQLWFWTYFANWPTLIPILDNSNLFLLGHFWSLCVEEHFYMVWPSMVYLFARANLFRACMVIVLFSHACRFASLMIPSAPIIMQWLTLRKLDGLAIGAVLALVLRDTKLVRLLPGNALIRRLILISGFLFLFFVGMPNKWHAPIIDGFGDTFAFSFFGLVLLAAVRTQLGGQAERILCSGVLVSLGKYSYGIYIIHGILRPLLLKLFLLLPRPVFLGSAVIYQLSYYLGAVSVSCFLAYASYHLVEKRFLSLKRFFEYSHKKIDKAAVAQRIAVAADWIE